MECTHWWGQHWHWFWIMPFLFMVLMFVCATITARRTGYWRCCAGRAGREGFDCGKPGQRFMADWGSGAPLENLDRRYAAGEITIEEHERMKRDIESAPTQNGPGEP